MKAFAELTEQEILALAISAEEEDARIYADFADGLKADYPASAQVFTDMAAEENEHRRRLIELHRQKFGEHIPLVRRQDVRGFVRHEPLWLVRPLGLDRVRKHAEADGVRGQALLRTRDGTHHRRRRAQAPGRPGRGGALPHHAWPSGWARQHLTPSAQRGRGRDAPAHVRAAGGAAGARRTDGRLGVDAGAAVRGRLRHPRDAGRRSWSAWPPRVGAGISMGFAEALSDDGSSRAAAIPCCAASSAG